MRLPLLLDHLHRRLPHLIDYLAHLGSRRRYLLRDGLRVLRQLRQPLRRPHHLTTTRRRPRLTLLRRATGRRRRDSGR